MCYEQSCAFHYQPGLNEKKKPILCADELTLMALNQDAEGQVHFAVKPYSIEPEDPNKMADCLRNFISLSPAEKASMGKNAKHYADQFYNVDNS